VRKPGENRVEFDAESIREPVHEIEQTSDDYDVEGLLFAELLAQAIKV